MEMILEKVSEYDIFTHYFGHFEIGRVFNSPLREDNTPSFEVNQLRNGRLMFIDYGQSDKGRVQGLKGGVTDLLRILYPGRNYNELLEILDKDMGLGFTTGTQTYKKKKTIIERVPRKDAIITITPRRDFDTAELSYWNKYTIDRRDLRECNWYPIKKLYLDGIKQYISPTELIFAILFDEKYWKIYRPYGDKRRKWITNVPHRLMYGLENLEQMPADKRKMGISPWSRNGSSGNRDGKISKAIVTKASKDYMVTRKYFPYVCGVQSEGCNSISDENLSFIFEHVEQPYINFDPDEAGRAAAACYHQKGFRDLVTPEAWTRLEIKDNADIVERLGPENFKIYLKNNGLWI